MPESLSSLEMSLLALDTPHIPGHVGTVDVFGGDADFDYEHLIGLIRDRIPFVPRYRMRVRTVPLALGPSVWVEDEDFDLTTFAAPRCRDPARWSSCGSSSAG